MDPEHNQYVSYGPARGDAQRLPYAFKVDVGASPFPTRLVVGVLPAQVFPARRGRFAFPGRRGLGLEYIGGQRDRETTRAPTSAVPCSGGSLPSGAACEGRCCAWPAESLSVCIKQRRRKSCGYEPPRLSGGVVKQGRGAAATTGQHDLT